MSTPVIFVGSEGVHVAPGVQKPVEVTMTTGLPGKEGPPGPPGPPGTGTGGSSLTFIQSQPADTWVITHDLGYYPNVAVVDSTGDEVIGEVTYGPIGLITLTFSAAFSGSAYLS